MLFAALQRILPTRFLSWLMYKVTRVEAAWFRVRFIRFFMKLYRIDLAEAVETDPDAFPSFNAFFTRALKPGARPLPDDPFAFVSPVDGKVSQLGKIEKTGIFQAKGHAYSAADLLADPALAEPFDGGDFCTIYLAPNNYHRIHMPIGGTLKEWLYVPGRLFSVNPATVAAMPRLFARNERVVCLFDCGFGPMALVLVGALFVGSMETVWSGQVTPPHQRGGVARYTEYTKVHLNRGTEMGRFNMGSTVILLTPPGVLTWDRAIVPGKPLRMGERLATIER
ncbi:MAG TPA: archaetidylserine decarboxylase [Nevskiaceae bacterium]|nr:archaetidylserine decarboxylase [Nevskiaceae bacterium]